MIFPVYIVSKGRPDSSTARLLRTAEVPFVIVVEPQEAKAYTKRWGGASVLPKNDQGLAYARNGVLDILKTSGWVWMLDDDITRFYRAEQRRCYERDAKRVLTEASEAVAQTTDVAQAALEYQQFAWAASKSATCNSYCDVAVAIHRQRVGRIRFRPETGVKVDRDFTLQVLAAGWRTVRLNKLAFAAPKNGSNAGGLAPVYAIGGSEEAASRKMVELWGPEICQYHPKPDGRPDVKINWRYFQRSAVA